MDKLPQVLQKEIWEYVRGDRAYWRTQFQKAADHLEDLGHTAARRIYCDEEVLSRSSMMLKRHKEWIYVDGKTAEVCRAVGEHTDAPRSRESSRAYIRTWNHYVLFHFQEDSTRSKMFTRGLSIWVVN